jgi:hypothetical protein
LGDVAGAFRYLHAGVFAGSGFGNGYEFGGFGFYGEFGFFVVEDEGGEERGGLGDYVAEFDFAIAGAGFDIEEAAEGAVLHVVGFEFVAGWGLGGLGTGEAYVLAQEGFLQVYIEAEV